MEVREFVREAPIFYALAIAVGLSKGRDVISRTEIQHQFSAFVEDNDPEPSLTLLDSQPLWDLGVKWLSERGIIKVNKLSFGPPVYARGEEFSYQWSDLTLKNDGSPWSTYGLIRDGDTWLRQALFEIMEEEKRLKPTARDFALYTNRPKAFDQFDVPEHDPVSEPPLLSDDMDEVRKTDAIMDWFYANFEDPSQSTSYNSQEGGYLYVNGGPYELQEIFDAAFPGYEEDEVISVALREIEADSDLWVPSSSRARPPDDQLPDPPVEYLHGRMVRQAEELHELLRQDPVSNPGIGHNQPPEPIEQTPLQAAEKQELIEALEVLRAQPAQPESAEASEAALATLRAKAKKIGSWIGNQAAIFVEEAVKESGKQTGKWAPPVFWAVVLDQLTNLTARADVWIKTIIVTIQSLH